MNEVQKHWAACDTRERIHPWLVAPKPPVYDKEEREKINSHYKSLIRPLITKLVEMTANDSVKENR